MSWKTAPCLPTHLKGLQPSPSRPRRGPAVPQSSSESISTLQVKIANKPSLSPCSFLIVQGMGCVHCRGELRGKKKGLEIFFAVSVIKAPARKIPPPPKYSNALGQQLCSGQQPLVFVTQGDYRPGWCTQAEESNSSIRQLLRNESSAAKQQESDDHLRKWWWNQLVANDFGESNKICLARQPQPGADTRINHQVLPPELQGEWLALA